MNTQHKSRLLAQLADLEARQERIAGDLAEPINRDSEEAAIEIEDDEALEAQGSLVAEEIASVNRALVRIENGVYGICVHCGEKISHARLDARPEAALCIACASQERPG